MQVKAKARYLFQACHGPKSYSLAALHVSLTPLFLVTHPPSSQSFLFPSLSRDFRPRSVRSDDMYVHMILTATLNTNCILPSIQRTYILYILFIVGCYYWIDSGVGVRYGTVLYCTVLYLPKRLNTGTV